jgi:hypothetical protein
MRKSILHRIAIVIAAVAFGSAVIGTDALAAGGNAGVHGGGGMGGGHFGGAIAGDRFGGGSFAGRFEHGHHGRVRGLEVPFGYYDDGYSGYYDPSTVTPDEQPTDPTTASPYVKPPRSSCSTQTYKVPSEDGGEASINVVHC